MNVQNMKADAFVVVEYVMFASATASYNEGGVGQVRREDGRMGYSKHKKKRYCRSRPSGCVSNYT